MKRSTLTVLYSLSLLSLTPAYAYKWPSPQYDTLEELLYMGRRSDGSSLASLVHPCRKRTGTLGSIPAEWLRFAFHDMATHNVDDGSGGMDGSLVYELGRPENFGIGFNQTLGDFESFPNVHVSRADVIAVGAIMAVSTCGGPIIPLRGGRVDTWTPGPGGTPEPQHDLQTLTESFRKQGFTSDEMIKLVACGHSFGGVRSSEFPSLVPPDPNSLTAVIHDFDTTPNFDNAVVTEYLSGSTQNPLVVGANKTLVSDLRVFESDGNRTVQSLADKDTYASQCTDLLARMIDVVPKDVTLTDEITLLPVKVNYAQLVFEKGQLVFKTSLRLLQAIKTDVNKNRVTTLLWCDKYGSNAGCSGKTSTALPVSVFPEDPNLSPITLNLGYYFVSYNYVVPIASNTSISKFWFEMDEKDGSPLKVFDNNEADTQGKGIKGGDGYPIDQDQVLFAPMLSSTVSLYDTPVNKGDTSSTNNTVIKRYTLVTGIRDGVNPSRVHANANDVAIRNFTEPFQKSFDMTLNSTFPPLQGYSFYTAIIEDPGMQMTLDIFAEGADGKTYQQNFVETLLLDNTPYVKPASVVTIGGRSSAASRTVIATGGASLLVAVFSAHFLGAWDLIDWVIS
ncbi:L-ascorbate oxidase [Panaeolus papilionaceus]|nr:L-ascorbate oxidase [Panaeolus papilionaceus]